MRAAALAASAALLLLLGLAAAQPTILNGDFEDWPGAWTPSGGAQQTTTEMRSGTSAAAFRSQGTLSQVITGLIEGTSYTVTLWVKTGDNNPGTYGGLSITIDSSTTVLLAPFVANTVYQAVAVNFKALAGASKASLTITGALNLKKRVTLGQYGYYVDDITIGVCSLCGDPHIVGLDNSRYDFMGEAGMVFALLSEPSVQLNSRFVTHGKGTGIGPLCIRTCQHTLEIHPNHTVLVDGKLHASATKSVAGKSEHIGKEIVMTQYNARMTWLSFGAWSMLLRHGKSNFDIINLKHHADHDTEDLHGVYGMSALPNHHQHDKKHCQPWKNGGCELIGKWQDYALADQTGLCGAEWTYTKFDAKKC